jgi:TolB protein
MNRARRVLVLLSVPAACLMAAPFVSAQRSTAAPAQTAPPHVPSPINVPGERHLRNIKQLTNGDENAEAYFSFDGKRLSFQSTRGRACDQIYTMNIDGTDVRRISNGEGRTTCSFYYPDGKHILYASTYLAGAACPPAPDQSFGYAWAIYDSYDIFRADADGRNIVQLTKTPGYDAEATIAKDGTGTAPTCAASRTCRARMAARSSPLMGRRSCFAAGTRSRARSSTTTSRC